MLTKGRNAVFPIKFRCSVTSLAANNRPFFSNGMLIFHLKNIITTGS